MKPSYLISLSLIFMLGIAACQEVAEKENETLPNENEHFHLSRSEFESNQMQLLTPKEMQVKETIKCSGNIDVPPQNRALITAIMGGYVKESPLLVGDQVKKGQVLLSLENPAYADLQGAYLDAKADLKYLQADYERQLELQKERINATKDFQKIESDLQKAKAKQKSLAEKLALIGVNVKNLSTEQISSQIQIKSPIEGTISMVNISKGTYVNPTEALMEILDTDHLHLELDVFEKDILKVKKHQEILFQLPELGSTERRGEVHLIGNLLDGEKRSVKVHGHLDGLDSMNLAVGMFVEADIVVDAKAYPSVPTSAVYEINQQNCLLVLANESEDQLEFDQLPIEVIAEKAGRVAFTVIDNKELGQTVLDGAYHFVGETESAGHHH